MFPGVVHVATVLVDVVVFRLVALLILPTDWEDAPDWDVVVRLLNVGVTVAEGLVDASVLALLVSFRGLIGVVAVEDPHVVKPGRGPVLDDSPEVPEEDTGLVVGSVFEVLDDDAFELAICEAC